MKPEPEPFFKWDPDGDKAKERQAVRALIRGDAVQDQRRPAAQARDPLAGKRFLLRWAWAISTAVLVIGYFIIAALLTGNGGRLGL